MVNSACSVCSVYIIRVLSRNEFLGEKMVGRITGIGVWGNLLQESVSVPLSEHIYSSVFTGRQSLLYAIILYCNWERFGGEAWVFGVEASPPPPVDWTLIMARLESLSQLLNLSAFQKKSWLKMTCIQCLWKKLQNSMLLCLIVYSSPLWDYTTTLAITVFVNFVQAVYNFPYACS